MAFPTIPTVAASRVLTGVQANTTATRTFPSLTGLTKSAGDLLIAIIVSYGPAGVNGFTGWTAGWTSFHNSGAASGAMGVGMAYRFSDGTETGTISVTEDTPNGHAAFFLLSISGAHPSTIPEAGSRATGTSAAADPAAFDPSGWAAEDTLWIAVAGSGETSLAGSYTGAASAPTNYTNYADTGMSADAIGACEGAVAFRQLNAASEDVGTFSVDLSQARNVAVVVAVRPAAATNVERAIGGIGIMGFSFPATGELVVGGFLG